MRVLGGGAAQPGDRHRGVRCRPVRFYDHGVPGEEAAKARTGAVLADLGSYLSAVGCRQATVTQ
ncbi:hypothetical protein GCM10012280_65510 [Wenjunlia tyrosinilytica]|uniref:Uncharacterized protein n=1 Tax=Wenjunlia tyrosinilytica TaxID=1544741 RepID=A0A917ZXD1_9ACTN|nr:hypothetical protein GCM10012280_65510 [Wenjunlia tyrosinilytica]